MNSGPQSNYRRIRGSVILLVLVTVLLVAFLLTKFVHRAGTELLTDVRAADQARLRREAYSALEATLAVLADFRAQDRGLFSPAQGWDQPLEYAGYTPTDGRTVSVTLEDESGKLSLPRADAATLEVLLEILGLPRSDAERVADALLVWTRADHVSKSVEATAGQYERAALPHHPAGRPLRSFAELASVATARDFFFDRDGQPTPLARDFAANVSLYSFDRMNLNAANPVALAVGGLAPDQMDAMQTYLKQQKRAGHPGFFRAVSEAAVVFGSAPMQAFGAETAAVRITVTVQDGMAIFRMSAVVAPPGGATLAVPILPPDQTAASVPQENAGPVVKKLDYPFKVLEIREDMESTTPAPNEFAAHE